MKSLKTLAFIILSVLNVNCTNSGTVLMSEGSFGDIQPQNVLYKTEITIIEISLAEEIENLVEPQLTISEDSLLSTIQYPEIARRAGVQGIILVEFNIDDSGNISDFTITQGLGAGCDENLINAFNNVKYTPAYYDSTPTAVKMKGSFRFRLYK